MALTESQFNTGQTAATSRLNYAACLAAGPGVLQGRQGIFPNGAAVPLRVHQTATASANLLIEIGAGAVQGTNTGQLGMYPFANTAQVTFSSYLSAHPASSQPRIDIIGVSALDTTAGDATTSFAFTVVQGTAGSGVAPILPKSFLPLAQINLPASVSTVLDSYITQIAPYAASVGGSVLCRNNTEYPTNPHPGYKIFDLSQGLDLFWDGSTWRPPKGTVVVEPVTVAGLSTATVNSTTTTGVCIGDTLPSFPYDTYLDMTYNALILQTAGDFTDANIYTGIGAATPASIAYSRSVNSMSVGGSTFLFVPAGNTVVVQMVLVKVTGSGNASNTTDPRNTNIIYKRIAA